MPRHFGKDNVCNDGLAFGSESSEDPNKIWKINLEKSFKFLNGLQYIDTLTSSYCGSYLLLLAIFILNIDGLFLSSCLLL